MLRTYIKESRFGKNVFVMKSNKKALKAHSFISVHFVITIVAWDPILRINNIVFLLLKLFIS